MSPKLRIRRGGTIPARTQASSTQPDYFGASGATQSTSISISLVRREWLMSLHKECYP